MAKLLALPLARAAHHTSVAHLALAVVAVSVLILAALLIRHG